MYGRVIGNELRDVPPECLPIWGQRWSGYRAPHGPSSFSTRVFSADRMSEVGPVLTSPTQFEMVLTGEDGEVASSESSRFRSSFLSSPPAGQAKATEVTSRPETPILPNYRSSDYPLDGLNTPHRSTGSLFPHTLACPNAGSFTRHRSNSIQDGHGSPENNYDLRDMDRTLTSIQSQSSHLHPTQIPCGQLEYTTVPHFTPEWQLAIAPPQSSAYPFHISPSSQLDGDCFLLPFQANDETMSPTSTSFTVPLPRQNEAIDLPQNYDPSITMTPGTGHLLYPVSPTWPLESTLRNPSYPKPSQYSGPAPRPGGFYDLVPDHHRYS